MHWDWVDWVMILPFLFDGSGKAALLLSSMTLHDLCSSSPCTVPLPAQSRKPAAMGERLGPGRLPGSIYSGTTVLPLRLDFEVARGLE